MIESVASFGGWEVSLTSDVLETVWSFAGVGVGWGVYLSYKPQARVCRVGRLSFEPYTGIYLIGRCEDSLCLTSRAKMCLVVCQVGSCSYTPRSAIYLIVLWVGSLSYTPRDAICLVEGRVGSLSYTPRPGICLVVRRVESLY